jgi:methionyl-tRNA formyltransferase
LIVHSINDLPKNGDILFLVSCHEKISKKLRSRFDFTLVLHASDLPFGKGWSPHIWALLEGDTKIVLSLLNASDEIDAGDIWKKIIIEIDKYDLFNDINNKIFDGEIELINWACKYIYTSKPMVQNGKESFYKKRTPSDSEIDANKTILEQFNKIRVCDPKRYPSFFYLDGKKFKLIIERIIDEV